MDKNLEEVNQEQNNEQKRKLFTERFREEVQKSEGKYADLFEQSKKEALEKFEQQQKSVYLKNDQQTQPNSGTTHEPNSESEKNDPVPKRKPTNEANSAKLIDPNLPQFNILLLGETGAGKSTTINALANYVKYASFDQAAKANFVELISSCFTLSDPNTGEDFPIKSGSDDNECHSNVGASRTQEPMAYQFLYQDKLVRIIDTPGMGDTRGMMVDKKNFDLILNYLTYYKELHAICVLIKSNEARKIASFRYCITELLTRLHRNACKNIIFCFTFSRNTFYAPGDGFVMLREFLSEKLPEVDIELRNAVNCFFVDNEAYRFLVAKKCGFPFLPYQANSYKESWDKSAAQTNTMIEQILKLDPHKLEETLELNRTGKLIVKLAQPLVRLQVNLNHNLKRISNVRNKFAKSIQTKDILQKVLNVVVYDLAISQLEFPATVCAASKCVETINLDNQYNVHYSTRCHEHCTEVEIDVDTIGHDLMRNCTAMAGTSKCQSCGCNWKEHLQLTVEYKLVEKTLIDSQNIEKIFNQEKFCDKVDLLSRLLKQLQDDYVSELDCIQETCGIFGYLLEKYSNTSFSRFIEPHLDMLISEEEKKLQRDSDYSEDSYRALLDLKQIQEIKIEKFKANIESKKWKDAVLKDVKELCDKLIGLKASGAKLKQIIEAFNSSNLNQKEHIERLAVNLVN